ncbi:MAG: hypothetical protein N2381_11040, partial [Armatimonadetes bacterium]|nr:hypothetical protein [Armatimonadota bacterium]
QSVVLEGTEHDCRASPLIVRVVKLADGKCALVLLHFVAPLLPADEQLSLRRGNTEIAKTQQPDDAILGKFVAQLRSSLEKLLNVTGW